MRIPARLCVSIACLAIFLSAARGDETPPQSVLSSLHVPQGFSVELVAGPPLVERPMLASFDDRGRLYVCDSAGVNLRGAELSKNPPHKIRLLEDTDGDGRFDKSSVFADKLVFPQGIVWHAGAVYCASPPSFWKLEDTDGDDVADRRTELVTGFANTGVADDLHGGSLGPDGRIYWCAGRFPHEIHRPGGPVIHRGTAPLVLRCLPDGSELEVVCGSQGNAVGVAFSPSGDMFASGTFLAPNSMGAGLRDALVHCIDGAEYPVRDRTLNEHKRTGDLLPPLTHLGVAAASDLTICRNPSWGDEYRGNLFSALFNMHKVMRHTLEPAGATFACRNHDFLTSDHPDFHPTDVFDDADGSLLVIDTGGWFRIGCPTSQIAKPEVLGAIYRIRKTDAPRVDDPRGAKLAWTTLDAEKLAALLSDPRPAVRDRAVEQLAALGTAALPALEGVLTGGASSEGRCAAVWALMRIQPRLRSNRFLLREALDHDDPAVRQAAARAAGILRDSNAFSALISQVGSDTPAVRREAATALGRLGNKDAVPALLDALNAAHDRFLEHALIFALISIGDRPGTLKGLELASSTSKRGALIALDQMDGGQLTPEVVLPFLTPSDPLMQQTALWVIAHHGEWGQAMLDFFRTWLARQDMDDARRDDLKRQLLAFARDDAVQQLIGTALADAATPRETRLLLLEVIAQSEVAKLPAAWTAPLRQALADADSAVVRQAVIALRALPLDKRPLVARVDAQVNFPMTEHRFAGTRLEDFFCVRWSGVVRCPRDGEYRFFTDSDDGSQLFIDGKLVVDNGGAHAMREREGRVQLQAGDHALRLEFIEDEGDAGCILSWQPDGQAKEVIPAEALLHRPVGKRGAEGPLQPGLLAEFYEIGGRLETFPDVTASEFDAPLLSIALDAKQPLDVRVQAAAAAIGRLPQLDPPLLQFLLASLDESQPPLVRLDAAEALSRARLDAAQLTQLADVVARTGVLELPKLLPAFEQSTDPAIGRALVSALARSPGLKSLQRETLVAIVEPFGAAVVAQAQPLVEQLTVDRAQQTSRLTELADVLTTGDVQRGRDLFFANKKAICATCHSVQGQGGKIGPDLSRIGAIRTGRDLLEAIVFPSASFARGYEPFSVVTDEGRVHAGIIARETSDAIYLVDNSRAEIRIARGSIESMQQGRVSIMPEGMDTQLGRQDLADLIAFLQSLR